MALRAVMKPSWKTIALGPMKPIAGMVKFLRQGHAVLHIDVKAIFLGDGAHCVSRVNVPFRHHFRRREDKDGIGKPSSKSVHCRYFLGLSPKESEIHRIRASDWVPAPAPLQKMASFFRKMRPVPQKISTRAVAGPRSKHDSTR